MPNEQQNEQAHAQQDAQQGSAGHAPASQHGGHSREQHEQRGGSQVQGDHKEQGPDIKIDPKRKLGRLPILLAACALLVLAAVIGVNLLGRRHGEHQLQVEAAEQATDMVSVVSPKTGADGTELVLPADTQAYTDTPVYARTSGYLRRWYADIGTRVHRGQVLAVIDTPELDRQVQQASEDVDTAQANAQLAQTTADRWQKLLAKNAVSKQEADQTRSDLSARQSQLRSSQANLSRLQQMQGFETVYAPFDGVITARKVDVGSLITAGDPNSTQAATQAELFHITSAGRLRLFIPVPEIYMTAVHDGEQVRVTSDAFPNQSFQGEVVRNARSVDLATRTLNVEVDVANPKQVLVPGQYAFVHLPLRAQTASLSLPSNALLFRREGLRVGLLQGDRIHLQPITVGQDYGETVEVLSGLKSTDKVVLNPSDSLSEGQQVRVERGGQGA